MRFPWLLPCYNYSFLYSKSTLSENSNDTTRPALGVRDCLLIMTWGGSVKQGGGSFISRVLVGGGSFICMVLVGGMGVGEFGRDTCLKFLLV